MDTIPDIFLEHRLRLYAVWLQCLFYFRHFSGETIPVYIYKD